MYSITYMIKEILCYAYPVIYFVFVPPNVEIFHSFVFSATCHPPRVMFTRVVRYKVKNHFYFWNIKTNFLIVMQ